MHINKRRLLQLLATAAFAAPVLAPAQEAFPSRPVRIVVGFPAGSSTDVAARVLAQRLGEASGQQFVVENKPGASSNIAARTVASAPADGYTLFMGTIANTINASLLPNNSVDISREFMPVAMVGSVPNVLVAHPSLGVETVQQLIDKAKAEPNRITYASSGNGTSPHLSGELFSHMAGVRMLHVPYKGSSPAVVDLLAGQVNTMFAPASTALPHIRAGKLKALASTGPKRSDFAPELPTVEELGLKGFETSVWFGLNAPLGTPPQVVERLRTLVHAAQDDAQVQSQLKAQGIELVKAGPKEYGERIQQETDKWARVIKLANVKPE
ncbi:Bug family tripartite tricarboxylate transporter substrate binding protein [Ramlibacter rhizophilus]|uniref:Tripartite tricarboxylate transporter substrate binding protein n=1 Tax=Ramlibacter rhizophilus TaxID=1781167 RepID=A0A4Z0BN40_9BURK|nr:tripartite tricarboxylate transporter substrate binding protein [Ramlibacter rhizophilus]TFY99839.1 tripartite tricarboxylate transporter substrate binding protein [Ramlibacter rhizophilus]